MTIADLQAMKANLEHGLRQMMEQRNELEIRIRRQEGALQLAGVLLQQEREAAAEQPADALPGTPASE